MAIHIERFRIFPEQFPTRECYPFDQKVFQETREIELRSPVTMFVGENGTGKSTLLKAICHKCGIHIWRDTSRTRYRKSPYEERLYRYCAADWCNGPVKGAFFASDIFRHFAQGLDEWASEDPGILEYFGGRSLLTQSHGQSLMSFFAARCRLPGLYLLDEPETALSPKSQLQLLDVLQETGVEGEAQFVIATHSPIPMACPSAKILSLDTIPVAAVRYEDTDHFRIYREFMRAPQSFLQRDSPTTA